MIETKDSLEYLRSKADFEFDMNYSDPPYALGSEVMIRPDGKVDYKKANDFMNKWEMPTGAYWEQWFKEAYRTLKHGGYLVMFGMDRQLLLFKYYANLAGFTEQQSLYWYFISNFPKATDLSKQIDKNAGAEREVVDKQKMGGTARKVKGKNGHGGKTSGADNDYDETIIDITTPSTDLAKKYDGYKYSISPLKQTNETIMVFQKPYKTKSCLHDTLAYENGDDTCCCGAFDIDGNRVPTDDNISVVTPMVDATQDNNSGYKRPWMDDKEKVKQFLENKKINALKAQELGRYPSQTFCDSNTAEVLDKQSGLKCGQQGAIKGTEPSFNKDIALYGDFSGYGKTSEPRNDIGGCSKILHKCDFEDDEHDLYFYNPKVSKSERNAGCEEIIVNNHPTLKPIKLNERILKLFKTPNEQKIIYPFAGSGSEVIGGIKAGFKNWCGCELNQEYVDITEARIEHWGDQKHGN